MYECCDLYINPRTNRRRDFIYRCAIQGVPVVTLPEGDVYDNIGDSFAVNGGYDEMADEILHYMNDVNFYQSQSGNSQEYHTSQMVEQNDEYYADAINELEDRLK